MDAINIPSTAVKVHEYHIASLEDDNLVISTRARGHWHDGASSPAGAKVDGGRPTA